MIVHIFRANSYHLSPNIAKGYVKNYNEFKHVIILYGDEDTDKQLYDKVFSELNFEDYHFCTNHSEYIALLKQYKERPILFHSGNYSWFLLAIIHGVKNINWVCWGAGASIGNSVKSKVATPLKRFIYNKFKSIVVLMDQDKESIIRDFKVPEQNIQRISYASQNTDVSDEFYIENIENEKSDNHKPLVLLGNNPSNMSNYINDLDFLRQYAGKILVQCMLHYSLEKNDMYYELVERGRKYFGNDFKTNEEFYSDRVDYINYMNKCDVYISSATKQTGLGAIGFSLRLGKKVYINGKNHEWMTSRGMKIFHTSEITESLSYEEFVSPLSKEEQLSNFYQLKKTSENNPQKWNDYFRKLLNQL